MPETSFLTQYQVTLWEKKIQQSTVSTTRHLRVSFGLSHKTLVHTKSKHKGIQLITFIPVLSHSSFFIVQVSYLTSTTLNVGMC